MADKQIPLMAHLMRRAGFGAPYEEIEARAARGYETIVEELVDPDAYGIAPVDPFLLWRYNPQAESIPDHSISQMSFMYYMVSSLRPLEEKMTLFWHMIFATGNSKVDNPTELQRQVSMFRQMGLGSYKDLLLALSKDPAMLFWLDNNENHKHAPNENWGRELLELFSMGQGNYSEDDVKMASRAFTGWTIKPKVPRIPYGRYLWGFEYQEADHDDGEKTFLGRSGNFNGDDIIDIIVQQPATAQFVARHLYSYFVADEVQVPSWNDVPPRDPDAVNAIADVFVKSNYQTRDTLRFIFNSDFFKDESAWFAKVKNPVEVVAGTLRLVGEYQTPRPELTPIALETGYQGQELTNPPSVEGWHTGAEWVDTGSLVRRVNFMAQWLSDASSPGVQSIISRLGSKDTLTSAELVDGCLELLGAVQLNEDTRRQLIEHSDAEGEIRRGSTADERQAFGGRVTGMLQLIAACREYQFC